MWLSNSLKSSIRSDKGCFQTKIAWTQALNFYPITMLPPRYLWKYWKWSYQCKNKTLSLFNLGFVFQQHFNTNSFKWIKTKLTNSNSVIYFIYAQYHVNPLLAWLTFPSIEIYYIWSYFCIDYRYFFLLWTNLFVVTLLADMYSTLQTAIMHKNMVVDIHVLSQAPAHTDVTITSFMFISSWQEQKQK